MGNIIISVDARLNNPPDINNISITTANRYDWPITLNNFLVDGGYTDPENDPLGQIIIDSLPVDGSLIYGTGNNNVSVNQIFTNSEINSGVLKYRPPSQNTIINTLFNFRVSDNVELTNYSPQRRFSLQVPPPPSYGEGFGIKVDLNASSTFSIVANWNKKENLNNYTDFDLGVLRLDNPYSDSPIYNGLSANKIVIESFTDDIVVTNNGYPNFWDGTTAWTPNPPNYNQKQLLDSSNNPVTLPYTINLPGGNTPVTNLGVKVNFTSGELIVPTTVGTSYSSFRYSYRRLIIGYKIYSGNVAQTPTLYFMWYKNLDSA